MKNFVHAVLAAAIAASGAVVAGAASAADMVVGVYASDPGACADTRVLGRISERFRWQVRNVPHLPQVEIVDFQRIGQTRYRPAHDTWPPLLPRHRRAQRRAQPHGLVPDREADGLRRLRQ